MIAKKKSKKELELERVAELPEGIFGDTSVPKSVRLKKKAQKQVDGAKPASKTRSARVMPRMEINYKNVLPKEAAGLKLSNVVDIPVELLKKIRGVTTARTKKLSTLLLTNAAPSALSYDAASSYVKTVLADGLKIDVEIDKGVLEVVNDACRLDVIYFFVQRLKLPTEYKRRFMNAFIDELSKSALENMKRSDKTSSMSNHIRELEGVIGRRSEAKIEHRRSKPATELGAELPDESPFGARPKRPMNATGVRKPRGRS